MKAKRRFVTAAVTVTCAATSATATAGPSPAERFSGSLLPGAAADPTIETGATVNQTPGGSPAGSQLVGLGGSSRAEADELLAPNPCDTSQGAPGAAMP